MMQQMKLNLPIIDHLPSRFGYNTEIFDLPGRGIDFST